MHKCPKTLHSIPTHSHTQMTCIMHEFMLYLIKALILDSSEQICQMSLNTIHHCSAG